MYIGEVVVHRKDEVVGEVRGEGMCGVKVCVEVIQNTMNTFTGLAAPQLMKYPSSRVA